MMHLPSPTLILPFFFFFGFSSYDHIINCIALTCPSRVTDECFLMQQGPGMSYLVWQSFQRVCRWTVNKQVSTRLFPNLQDLETFCYILILMSSSVSSCVQTSHFYGLWPYIMSSSSCTYFFMHNWAFMGTLLLLCTIWRIYLVLTEFFTRSIPILT
jgi:hypothetical protein